MTAYDPHAPPPLPPPGALDAETIELAHQLFDLARAGDGQLAELVDAGVPVDLTDPRGNSLLMLAAYHGHAALVADLVARGADLDRRNDRGQTPLAAAAFRGAPDVVEVLLDAGADPSAGAPSALETARFFERDEIAALLEAPPDDA